MDDLIREVKDQVDASEAAFGRWREEAREDLLMVAGEGHWPAQAAQERAAQRRACLTVNQLPQYVNRVVGEFRLNQFAISVKPSDSQADLQVADVYEGLIRAVQYDSVAKVAYRTALSNAAGCGLGWWRVAREYESWDAWEQVLRIMPVFNPFSVYPDGRSRRHDLEDSSAITVLDEIPLWEFEKRWKGAATKDVEAGTGNRKREWFNERDKSVTVAEHWRKTPVKRRLGLVGLPEDPANWQTVELTEEALYYAQMAGLQVVRERMVEAHKLEMALVSGGDVLEKLTEQPGRYFPFVPVRGEEIHVDGEHRLWGVVRHAKEPQRIWNYNWTAAVEAVALAPKAPYLATARNLAGYEAEWDGANQETLPYLRFNPDPEAPGFVPRREANPVTPAAALTLVEKAERMLQAGAGGVYEAALGKKSNEQSGVAIEKRQVASSVNVATYPDNLTLAMEHTGRILVDLIPHTYDSERVIRVLGEDFAEVSRVAINGTGLPDLTRGRYDVVATVGPAYNTRREEAFAGMAELGKIMGDQAAFIADLVVGYSDFPGRQELVERIKQIQAMQGFSEDGQVPPQMAEQIQQLVAQTLQQLLGMPEQGNGGMGPGMMDQGMMPGGMG